TTIIAQSTSIRSLKPNMAMTPKKALEWTEATMARLFCNEIRWGSGQGAITEPSIKGNCPKRPVIIQKGW
ncbi:MAG: hypothetical protein AB1847_18375, partial [bacterium]